MIVAISAGAFFRGNCRFAAVPASMSDDFFARQQEITTMILKNTKQLELLVEVLGALPVFRGCNEFCKRHQAGKWEGYDWQPIDRSFIGWRKIRRARGFP
jgi:hypothetical protein